MSWASRFRPQEVQAAARNLADQVGIPPGKVRVVFQTVTDVAILGTVLVTGTLAAVHLYKALFPKQKGEQPGPQPAAGDGAPPHRRGRHVAAASTDGPDGHEKEDHRSR